jgi:DNA-binding beta-propeller fold protein YncE
MIFDSGRHKYELLDDWPKLPEGISLREAVAMSIDSQDRVFIYSRQEINSDNPPMMVFDREGNMLSSWGEGWFGRAHGVYVGPDDFVYCADMGNHTVSKWTPEGELLLTLGNKDQPSDTGYEGIVGWEPQHSYFEKLIIASHCFAQKHIGPPFNRPTGVYVTASGDIFVSDGYGNAQIHRFSPDGKLLSSWGELGDNIGQFICPHGIWVDKQEQVWVADRANCRVEIFDAQGKYIRHIGELGQPAHVYIDDEGTVFVPECLTLSVAMFTTEGKLLARWHNHELENIIPFTYPHVTAVDSAGDLYFTNAPPNGGGFYKFAKIS